MIDTEHYVHNFHEHDHDPTCGHVQIAHDGHIDYLHDGHLHHVHGAHVDEHQLEDPAPQACDDTSHACDSHIAEHEHGVDCGHEAVPHAGHIDYLVDGHIHRIHDGHCDDHGVLERR